MLSLQQISDRLEIQQLFIDYAEAIDTKNFDGLDAVFTPDAFIDYRALGGTHGQYPQVKAWLTEVLNKFPRYYHLVSNVSLKIDGDTASSRIICSSVQAGRPRKLLVAVRLKGPLVSSRS